MIIYQCKICDVPIVPSNMHTGIMCNACWNTYHNDWQKNNKDKVNKYRRKNYAKNPTYEKVKVKRHNINGVMKIEVQKQKDTVEIDKEYQEMDQRRMENEAIRKLNGGRLV